MSELAVGALLGAVSAYGIEWLQWTLGGYPMPWPFKGEERGGPTE